MRKHSLQASHRADSRAKVSRLFISIPFALQFAIVPLSKFEHRSSLRDRAAIDLAVGCFGQGFTGVSRISPPRVATIVSISAAAVFGMTKAQLNWRKVLIILVYDSTCVFSS
jgi:hypothetical protein